MKISTVLIMVVGLICPFSYLLAQSFSLHIEDEFETAGWWIEETPDGNYLIGGTKGDELWESTPNDNTVELFKVNPLGEVVQQSEIVTDEAYLASKIINVASIPTVLGEYFVYGTANHQVTGDKQTFVYRVNQDLELLWDTIYGELNRDEVLYSHFWLNDTIWEAWGSIQEDGSNVYPYRSVMHIDGHVLRTDEMPYLEPYQNGAEIHFGGDNYILHNNNPFYYTHLNAQDLSVDTVFEDHFPNDFWPWGWLQSIDEERYLIQGDYWRFDINDLETYIEMAFVEMDVYGNVRNLVNVSDVDTTTNTAYNTNVIAPVLSFIDTNAIFIAGKKNVEGLGSVNPEFMVIANLKLNGEQNWIKKIYTNSFSISNALATSDGGVIITGLFYQESVGVDGDYDLFIMKLDENGLLVNSTMPHSIVEERLAIFPNPTKGVIHIYNPFPEETKILCFNIYGQQIEQFTLSPSSEKELNLLGHPAGVYIYQVLNKAGQLIDVGQMIKQ